MPRPEFQEGRIPTEPASASSFTSSHEGAQPPVKEVVFTADATVTRAEQSFALIGRRSRAVPSRPEQQGCIVQIDPNWVPPWNIGDWLLNRDQTLTWGERQMLKHKKG